MCLHSDWNLKLLIANILLIKLSWTNLAVIINSEKLNCVCQTCPGHFTKNALAAKAK